MALTIDLPHARAFWFQRQHLAAPAPAGADVAAVIGRSGWLRTLGGVDVYLAARARVQGLGRAALDAAVDAAALRVIPAVRGCIYLVPAAHVPWALRCAEDAWRPRAEKEVVAAGATWREVEEVAAAAAATLRGGPLATDGIRRAMPPDALRSLGERGKKVGMASLLPTALRLLELADRVERTLEGGRLDSEHYLWRTLRALPPPGAVLADRAERRARLAQVFLGHAGPATAAHFAAWAGLGVREARDAITAADAVPVVVAGMSDEAWIARKDVDVLGALDVLADAAPAAIALLSFEDNFVTLHGGPALVTDPAHHALPAASWGTSRPSTLGDTAHLAARTVVIDGTIVGLWEVDQARGGGVWAPLGGAALPAAIAARVDAQVDETARFLLAELGHARSFTLDTADAVAERAARIAAMRPGARPAAKPVAKPSPAKAAKAVAKPAPAKVAKPVAKPAPAKPVAKPVAKPDAKPAKAAKPAAKPAPAKPAAKPVAKPAPARSSKPARPPAKARAAARPAPKTKAAPRRAPKSAAKPKSSTKPSSKSKRR